jgi:hypothetical protein
MKGINNSTYYINNLPETLKFNIDIIIYNRDVLWKVKVVALTNMG